MGGHGLDRFNNDVNYNALVTGAALATLLRAVLVREHRLVWALIGAGTLSWALGEIYYSVAFGDSGNVPIPSVADLFYLLFYPACYAGLVLLMRSRLERLDRRVWIDSAIAATGAAALGAALVFQPIAESVNGNPAKVLTELAYPVGDLALLMLVVFMFARSGWRPGRVWLLVGVSLICSGIADSTYLYLTATNSYAVGTPLDSLWPAAMLTLAFAAWQRPRDPVTVGSVATMRALAAPALFALIALAVLLYGDVVRAGAVALGLAATTLALVITRAAMSYRENLRMLDASRREALTDSLTGLGNRRRLVQDIERALAGDGAPATVLAMFDLDGFKLYNDRFGHMAGDTLLARLAHKLEGAVSGHGRAYRLGGDEFCVLVDSAAEHAKGLVRAAEGALADRGDGFHVSCSCGVVSLPDEADTTILALRLADDRMYEHKDGRRGSARHQARSVLLGVLREREPALHEHLHLVGGLAAAVGARLGMTAEQLDEVTRAAELHDIGKAAVPDAILKKEGPLDEDEWLFMRRHTIIGERILAEAPALVPVAKLVRSSHERWDGSGYPDGLTGDAIPLGARVIAVCDAFNAMTSDRPYSSALSDERALAELRRSAGTQFDPDVVEAFCDEWAETRPPALLSSG